MGVRIIGCMAGHFVYLYRATGKARKPMYVGYGESPDRASSHPDRSHNEGLVEWLKTGKYELTVAGPYATKTEGLKVESALISALEPTYNKSPSTGPTFLPLGVKPSLANRPAMPPLNLQQLGVKARGALLVYLAPGKKTNDGRRKFDPASPDDAVIVGDMREAWQIRTLMESWEQHPADSPHTLIGIYGPNSNHRIVAGSALIDTSRWGDSTLKRGKGRWAVPLKPKTSLDSRQLQGRRVQNVDFGNWSYMLHIWVDAKGCVRYQRT